jgi:hypothetical protein
MLADRTCDICSRSETTLQKDYPGYRTRIELDEDGLWICSACRKQLKSKPTAIDSEELLDPRLKSLVGKSAGAICRTLELPFSPSFNDIIEAASKIAYDQDMYMSTWLFVNLWQDGTTL